MWKILREGFDYDLWANRQWLSFLVEDSDRTIMAHILSAQRVWLERLDGVSLTAMPVVELSENTLSEFHRRWVDAMTGEDRLIEFHRTTGEPGSLSLSLIARHVINHGTYHRGEIRGLHLARGSDAFPETDIARWASVRD